MKSFTIWLKKPNVALFIGGDVKKGEAPTITTSVDNPQIIVDQQANTITIVEMAGGKK